ncbi:MAG: PKD domain-containing protein [Armatimonadota bacterium]
MRRAAVVLTAAIVLFGLTSAGFAQECEIPLYTGNLDALQIGGWGSGTVEVDEEESYLDYDVLKVETTGFFAGGRLELNEPLEASQFLTDPEGGYLKLVVKIHEPEPAQPMEGEMFPGEGEMFPGEMPPDMEPGMWGPGMEPGMPPPPEMEPGMPPMDPEMMDPGMMDPEMMDPGMMPPGMDPGMWDPGMMEPGMMEPGMGGPMAQPEPPAKISLLRALLVTDEGAIDSGEIDIAEYAEIVEDWVQIVLPLDRFEGPVDISEGQIKHIALFGDVEETFWVGDVTLGYEEQPLLADAGESRTVKVDEPVTFEAAPQPEGVTASYVWDFDDLDGIQEEGFNRETTWTFPQAGYYVVTLTVTDPSGAKVDRVDRVHVKVTE